MSSERPPTNGDPQADNPYAPPQTTVWREDSTPPTAPRPPGMGSRAVATAGCLSLGWAFLHVLNGQAFTNALVFLAACGVSALVWLPLLRSPRRVLTIVILAAHLVVVLAMIATLPTRCASQQQFNAEMDASRQGERP